MSQPMQMQPLDPEVKKRLIKWGVILLIFMLVLSFGSVFVRYIANYLWYKHDAGAEVVYWTQIRIRALLFLAGFVIATPILIFNARRALSATMVFLREPDTGAQAIVQNILSWGQRSAGRLILIAGPVIGFFFGLSLAANWNELLLFMNSADFGQTDPIFKMDYSFYVFRLPFIQAIIGWLFGLLFICAVVAAAIYFGIRSLAALARLPITVPAVRTHLSLLAAMGFLLVGLSLWFGRYDMLTEIGERFTGAGFTELQALGAKNITCVVLWIAALAALLNTRLWSPYAGILVGAAASALVFIVGVLIYPAIRDSIDVKPNAIRKQEPYIVHAIKATRWAYGLENITVRQSSFEIRPSKEALLEAEATLDNMRLWHPEILRGHVDSLQSLRDYYAFQDIDVDRYIIDGKQRMVMIGVRDLSVEGLDSTRRNWQNLHLQFTHGNGIVAVKVNEVDASGRPAYLLKDVPPTGHPDMVIEEPRIYYSDARVSGFGGRLNAGTARSPEDRYVLVRSRLPEFDYTAAGETEYRWTHDGGIPIGSIWTKFLFSVYFRDREIFFSGDITDETRLLWRRNVIVRAGHILPWITWDLDPYVAIVNGRLIWILDGYTVTDAIPYSEMRGSRINYIRNSVKFTIDAYTGEWKAYITDADDPILKVYDKIYQDLLTPVSEAGEALRRHFRYPEDLFALQSLQQTRYHVTDPLEFFRGERAWQISEQSSQQGTAVPIRPYYVQMRLPDEQKDGFLLILPFSPVGRPNMIGWLAAYCDPEDYGKLVLYQFSRTVTINGPAHLEAQFQQDEQLSEKMTLLGQGGSRIRHGNLLVVPIGNSIMYVKPLFLESEISGIGPVPELRLVLLAYGDKIVFADTYPRALEMLTGTTIAEIAARRPEGLGTEPGGELPAGPVEGVLTGAEAREALRAFEQMQQAARSGDWAAFGDAQERLGRLLREAAGAGE
ncbi:MAG: UPF0182 family protein [Armatimonadetes bacterium]|nr:UPF0182 family protein [Armatimonadota bacterium]